MGSGYWEQRRITYLWDAEHETRWIRQEKWSGGTWILLTGDVAVGNTEPGNSSFSMRVAATGSNWLFYVDAMICEVLA